MEGAQKKIAQPAMHDYLGHVTATQQDLNYYELALGTNTWSGEQYDIWEAVYSPVGKSGYRARIFDKVSGEIHPEVAAYWREHYDLSHILQRDWATLGPKLRGKTAPSIVGTAIPHFPMLCRVSTTTRCIYPKCSSGWRKRRSPGADLDELALLTFATQR